MHNLVKFLNSKEQILLMLPFRKNKLLGKKKKRCTFALPL